MVHSGSCVIGCTGVCRGSSAPSERMRETKVLFSQERMMAGVNTADRAFLSIAPGTVLFCLPLLKCIFMQHKDAPEGVQHKC